MGATIATPQRKCCHINTILVIGCNGSYHNDNFQITSMWYFRLHLPIEEMAIIITMTILFQLMYDCYNLFVNNKWKTSDTMRYTM